MSVLVNSELAAIARAYEQGPLGWADFRQRRRLLICQFTGLPLPILLPGHDVPAALASPASEDDTLPCSAAVDIALQQECRQAVALADVGGGDNGASGNGVACDKYARWMPVWIAVALAVLLAFWWLI